MRFYHRIALALFFIYAFEDNVLGAPTKGRYMWVNCKPDGNNANCVQHKGPWVGLPGPSQRLAPSATKDIVPVESSEDTPETETEEQSGESSGDLDPLEKKEEWMGDGPVQVVPQVEEPIQEEEASGELDYSNYNFPNQMEPKLSAEDLREDNVIQ